MQRSLQAQLHSGEIDEEEYNKRIEISQDVHSVLYNYSEGRLLALTLNKEFKEIIMKHSEFWGIQDMSEIETIHYNTIIKIFT